MQTKLLLSIAVILAFVVVCVLCTVVLRRAVLSGAHRTPEIPPTFSLDPHVLAPYENLVRSTLDWLFSHHVPINGFIRTVIEGSLDPHVDPHVLATYGNLVQSTLDWLNSHYIPINGFTLTALDYLMVFVGLSGQSGHASESDAEHSQPSGPRQSGTIQPSATSSGVLLDVGGVF
ncbi:hypothetical protein M407DRAFT_28289 [Tulasnella calospora MUT 4182]|uniref:Uncharacterized protein n=1 Tax=Tulasnella calospora MUT 4182 TaxID=1051891 RepID=A0A0C3Q1M1_9AGAM|nr:hypothetical protein M407DRAFT_28289 [Tulasnella calospora MUT 4182]